MLSIWLKNTLPLGVSLSELQKSRAQHHDYQFSLLSVVFQQCCEGVSCVSIRQFGPQCRILYTKHSKDMEAVKTNMLWLGLTMTRLLGMYFPGHFGITERGGDISCTTIMSTLPGSL